MFDGCLRFYLTTSGLSFLCFRVTYVLYLNTICGQRKPYIAPFARQLRKTAFYDKITASCAEPLTGFAQSSAVGKDG